MARGDSCCGERNATYPGFLCLRTDTLVLQACGVGLLNRPNSCSQDPYSFDTHAVHVFIQRSCSIRRIHYQCNSSSRHPLPPISSLSVLNKTASPARQEKKNPPSRTRYQYAAQPKMNERKTLLRKLHGFGNAMLPDKQVLSKNARC